MIEPSLVVARADDVTLTDEDFRTLLDIADRYLAVRNTQTALLESVGRWVETGVRSLPPNWRDELHTRAREALWWAFRRMVATMDADRLGQPPARRTHRLMATASGFVTGAAGLPGILADLPTSTLLVLRSIADIARSHGYDIRDPAVQAACMEAFAFGGPTDEDDDADLAFWSTRAAAPVLSDMLPAIAGRLAASWAAVLPAKAVPVVGSVASAAINWHFSGYFQHMAGIVFSLRPLEERYGRQQVRDLFSAVIEEMRRGRSTSTRLRKRLREA